MSKKVCVLLVSILCFACSHRDTNRLDNPPSPNVCIENYLPCEFDEQCCSDFCWRNQCVRREDLVIPDAGCTPDQVDIALLIDISDSMDPYIIDMLMSMIEVVEDIQPTVTIQIWVTPKSMPGGTEDGKYYQLSSAGTPEQAVDALQELVDFLIITSSTGGKEATLDIAHELLRSRAAWRFGTTVRAIIVLSDERPQSYQSPLNTMDDVCSEALPSDRLIVFTKSLIASSWGCFEKRSIWEVPHLGELLVDPCLSGPDI